MKVAGVTYVLLIVLTESNKNVENKKKKKKLGSKGRGLLNLDGDKGIWNELFSAKHDSLITCRADVAEQQDSRELNEPG